MNRNVYWFGRVVVRCARQAEQNKDQDQGLHVEPFARRWRTGTQ